MYDLVGNPENRFSHDAAQLISVSVMSPLSCDCGSACSSCNNIFVFSVVSQFGSEDKILDPIVPKVKENNDQELMQSEPTFRTQNQSGK